jgi:hypothetical protein
VDGANASPAARKAAADVHQARRVDGAYDLGPGVEDVADLVRQHRRRHVGVLDREGAAEAAALERIAQLHEIEPAHGAQQALWLVAHAQSAQGVARRVVGDPVWVIRANIVDREHVHEELGELVQRRRVLAKLLADHAGAGS